MADNIIIEIQNLSKRFGELIVLDNINVNIDCGENLIVFGQSGTGKSVLLKCIIGLLHPDSGKVLIKGKDICTLSQKEIDAVRKNIGFLFQGAALYDSMSVRENLEFPLKRHFTLSQKELDDRVTKTLEMVSLEDAIDKMPSELSGGMRKRVGLARSIITEPELMLYDEPTTGLDPITSKEISELILDLQKKLDMTSIVVTHDLVCAAIISDRVIFLKEGRIVHSGKLEELKTSKDPFLMNFFSKEIINEQ